MMLQNFSFIDDLVAGSDLPDHIDDLTIFKNNEIAHIISLTPRVPLVKKYNEDPYFQFHHFPIYATPDDTQVDEFVQLIKMLTSQGEKAVIHCQYGQERTGMFLAIYLMEIKGMTQKQAISYVRERRSGSLQTANAIDYLSSYYT